MHPADSSPFVSRPGPRALLAVVAALALGCGDAGGSRPEDVARAREADAAAVARRARGKKDGPEHALGIRWEENLPGAFERARREKKPVLIAFSARRQEHDFECEF